MKKKKTCLDWECYIKEFDPSRIENLKNSLSRYLFREEFGYNKNGQLKSMKTYSIYRFGFLEHDALQHFVVDEIGLKSMPFELGQALISLGIVKRGEPLFMDDYDEVLDEAFDYD